MNSGTQEIAQQLLSSIFIIFIGGTVASKIAQKIKVPDVVLFILVGLVIGPTVLGLVNIPTSSTVNQVILIFGASFILLHGGLVTEFRVLKKAWLSITLLSTLGVVITAAVVGFAAHFIGGLPILIALLLGAIVASTDPAALVPIFGRFPIRVKVAQTVISESAFTDATGAILTMIVFGMTVSSTKTSWISVVGQFLHLALGGILVGAIVGGIAAFLISENDRGLLREFTPMVIVLTVLASDLIAEHINASGFMSVFVAGLMIGNAASFKLTILPKEATSMHHFVDTVGLKLRMLIFILLGSQVDMTVLRAHWLEAVLVGVVFMFVARPLTVLACLLPDKLAQWTKSEILFFFWTRETGVIAAALVGVVSSEVPGGAILPSFTFVAILMTLLIQASTTPFVAKALKLLE